MKLALIQLKVKRNKLDNLENAKKLIEVAAKNNANIIALPEMFTCPYEIDSFKIYAESIKDSITIDTLSKLANKLDIYLIGGTFPEIDANTGKYYNSCPIFSPSGDLIHIQRKIHLFDVDLETVKIKESSIFEYGKEIKIIDTGEIKFSTAVCFDVRFPILHKAIRDNGTDLIIIPAAFSDTTGNAHWNILARARAIDNQVYFAMVSPAKSDEVNYEYYGKSIIVNPWGEILSQADTDENIIYADINIEKIKSTRMQMPLKERNFFIKN